MEPNSLQVLLSKEAYFEGDLYFKGSARIAGKLKGSIKGTGQLLIEAEAKVSADVEVDRLVLLGEFKGRVKAKKSVLMEPPAQFKGELLSPSLTIKEGVLFEGSSKKIS